MKISEYVAQDACGLAELIRTGKVTRQEVLSVAQQLAESINPKINAIVYSDWEKAAKDAESFSAGRLSGVPFLEKGLGTMVKGFPKTGGSVLFKYLQSEYDSNLVAKHRQAGLVLAGLSNAPEFGLNISTESKLYGAAKNPWSLEHSTGGSSGGAAAAVAAGIVPVAHASDGGGSIRIPASCCGVFGLKTTRGRLPQGPERGEGWGGMSADHVVSRTVRDSALMLDLTAGPDVGAPYYAPPPAQSYLEGLSTPPPKLRIAWTTKSFQGLPSDPECAEATEKIASVLRAAGHELIEDSFVFDHEVVQVHIHHVIITNIMMMLDLTEAKLGRAIREEELEKLTYHMYKNARRISGVEYAFSINYLHILTRKLAMFFEKYDVLLTPTLAEPPPKLGVLSMDIYDFEVYWRSIYKISPFCGIFNVTGQPAVSIPGGLSSSGLPLGVQIVGRYAAEDTLLKLSAQIEQAAPWPLLSPLLKTI